MIRRMLIAGVVVVALLAPAAPVSAYEDVCAFQGIVTTSGPVPIALAGATVDYYMSVVVGTCVKVFSYNSVGTLTGSLAGPTTGTGIISTGQKYAFTGAGGVVELAGQVVGTMVITPDVISGSSSSRFIVHATIVLVN